MQGIKLLFSWKITAVPQILAIFQLGLAILISAYLWEVSVRQEWQMRLFAGSKEVSPFGITPLDCMCIAVVLTVQIVTVPMALCLFYGGQKQKPTYLKNWIYFSMHSSIVTGMTAIVQSAGSGSIYLHLFVLGGILILQQLFILIIRGQVKDMEELENETVKLEGKLSLKRNYFRNILAFKNASPGDMNV
ncbi:unnamed protein product [Allacma fusca]|uniref:Uncharacterized protein n=1 Tax=Allacma fusca TaxID=39272 RepID=A0A8J2K1V3_9HEXA|nr:unnamed protein product [Allacma fusca]